MNKLRERLEVIKHQINNGTYKQGTLTKLVDEIVSIERRLQDQTLNERAIKRVEIRTVGNVINVAPKLILVNGVYVASSFKAFRKYCKTWGITQSQFVNWPFVDEL